MAAGGSDIYADCTFTSKKISDTAFEVELTYHNAGGKVDLRGEKKTVVLRKDGDLVFVTDKDLGYETKFRRK